MRASSLLATLGLFALAATANNGDNHGKTSDKLIDLTTESFDKLVVDPKSNKLVGGPWLIMFYAPWCGHCKSMMPIFNEFAEKYGDGETLNVGRISCDEGSNSDLCTSYNVNGFPTVHYLSGGYFYEFHGPRTIENFAQFIFSGKYETVVSEVLPVKL
jgi:protein disulfide-isomerase-like protein